MANPSVTRIFLRSLVRRGTPGALDMEVLDFIYSNARTIRDAGAEAEAAATDLLETFDVKDNIFLSTIWLETRCLFSGFETGIDFTSAVEEFRRILAAATAGDDALYQLERESNPSLGFVEFAGAWASSIWASFSRTSFREFITKLMNL